MKVCGVLKRIVVIAAAILCLGACGGVKGGEGECSLIIRCESAARSVGEILNVTAEFEEGESVFDITARECRAAGIHMEFNKAVYGSAYIKGIDNIYEFDEGGASGWVFSVNGEYPDKSCSDVSPKGGDIVIWEYVLDVMAK